jgi:two-component system sensor histidine kinase KdpD
MGASRPIGWRAVASSIGVASAALAASTAGVFLLETFAGVQDASTLYLLAVALVAFRRGSWASVGTAFGAFLAYNFLFVPPRFTFEVADPQRLLTLFLLLAVGLAIGRLTGLQRDEALRSDLRERDARALFAVSRAISKAKRTADALPDLLASLLDDSGMGRLWVGLGPTWAQEQVIADTAPGTDLPASGPHTLLRRGSDDDQPAWVRLSPAGRPSVPSSRAAAIYRLELADASEVIGSLCGLRDPDLGMPSPEQTRLLVAGADQIGQGIVRDRLSDQATELEVNRRSDELKAALLDSVSHDLRTPLATIRATAGTLADPLVPIPADKARAMAVEIDVEADRLGRLVGDLLDMSRIAGGALQARLEPMPLADLLEAAVERARPRLQHRIVQLEVSEDLPPVLVDQVLISQVLDNLLDNVALHATPEGEVHLSAVREGDAVRLRVQDTGPGVPPEAMPHLFEKFYRVSRRRGSARGGTGLGLALVKGLAEAMGGSASASASSLGGLAIDISLSVADGLPG